MSHLREIVVSEATEDDLRWIDKLSKFSYYEEDTRNLLVRAIEGDLKFWRFKDGCDGILAAKLVERGASLREFWIEFLTGTGLIDLAPEIHDDIWELARLAGCQRVSGIAQHRGLARVYERVLKVKPRATIFSEDDPNGR
jgi:hypothetical protein